MQKKLRKEILKRSELSKNKKNNKKDYQNN